MNAAHNSCKMLNWQAISPSRDCSITIDTYLDTWQRFCCRSLHNSTTVGRIKNCTMSRTDQLFCCRIIGNRNLLMGTCALVGNKLAVWQMNKQATLTVSRIFETVG